MTRRLIACRYCMIRAINAAVEVIGDRWSLLVLRDVMFGNRRHFRVLEESSEEGIASNILADRLRRLVSAGLLMPAQPPDDPDAPRASRTTGRRRPRSVGGLHGRAAQRAPGGVAPPCGDPTASERLAAAYAEALAAETG